MLLKNRLLIFSFLTLFPVTLQAQAWMPGFNYRRKLTLNKSKVSAKVTTFFPSTTVYSDQIDFPVFIEIIDKGLIFKNGSCGSKIQDSEGRDISFALSSAPSVALNFQLEEYDPVRGKLRCWIKISSLSANKTTTPATEIYFYYGGSILHNAKSLVALQTWNSDYSKVWHMNAIYQQVGIHQMSLTPTNNSSTFIEGKLATSAAFNGTSSAYVGANEINTSITISAWLKMNAFGTEQMILTNDSSGAGGFQLKVNAAGKLVVQTFNSLSPPIVMISSLTMQETGRWYHVWVSISPGNVTLYIDNSIVLSSSQSIIRLGPGGRTSIGASKQNDKYFNGQIDELRIQKTVISKEWMSTCYANQFDPKGFYTLGIEEYNTGGFSRFVGNNNQWNMSSNWTGNVVPPANSNILIPAGKKVLSTSNMIFSRLVVESGATLEVGSDLRFICRADIANNGMIKVNEGAALRFGGDVVNDGQLISTGTLSKVVFDGSGAEQEYSGAGTATSHVLENNQSSSSNTLLLAAPFEVIGFIDLKKGTLQSDRTLIMKATSQTATASLLPINSSVASVVGDVIVEQYISGGYPIPATARGWRLLSSPVYSSNTTESKSYDSRSFKEGIFVTGNGGIINGFDTSPMNSATIYTHDQSLNGTLSQKYVGIGSIDQKVEIGKGVYVFSRGSRHAVNAHMNQIQTQPFINPQSYVLKHVGKLFVGDLTIFLANKDMRNVGDGYNLIGNPYSASVRWGDVRTEKTTGFIWQFDPLNAAYIVDDSPNVIIPSGTGFFIRVATGEKSGKLTFSETSKYNSSTPLLPVLQSLKSSSSSKIKNGLDLKIILSKDKFQQPYVLKLTDEGYDGVNDLDALKIGEGHVNISSVVDQQQLSIDNRQYSAETKVIDLNITGTESGAYELLFESSFDQNNLQIKLIDTQLNIEKQMKATDRTYNFSIDKTASTSAGNLRFKVLLEQNSKTSIPTENLKVYPNPFRDKITVEIGEDHKESINIVVTDMLGKVVSRNQIGVGTYRLPVDTEAFHKGIYLLQLISEKTRKVKTTLKLIKL
ncbi:MAG: T9SS type A sorting domain-containing protein [Pedobacter sp.]|nr:T9SS type A sorting domain-containing protein [Pedobacter sp.]